MVSRLSLVGRDGRKVRLMLEDNLGESCFEDNLGVSDWEDNIGQTLSCGAPPPEESAGANQILLGQICT